MEKFCPDCLKTKPLSDFYMSRPNQPFRICKKCFNISQSENKKRYYLKNIEYFSRKSKEFSVKTKLEVVDAYGRFCYCCGEGRIEFLCIDHINGGGTQERKNGLRGQAFYRYLIKNNFPPGYRVLCHNCNMSLGKFGYCPHDKEQ